MRSFRIQPTLTIRSFEVRTNLQKNYDAVAKINQGLLDHIKAEPDVDWLEPIKSKNTDPNLLISCGSRVSAALSMKDPTKAAKIALKTMQLHKQNISVLVGFGPGILTNQILKKMETGHKLVVIEPVSHMIRTAFANFDYSGHIEDNSLIIVTPGLTEVSITLHLLSQQLVVEQWMVTINKYTQIRPDEYGNITKFTSDTVNQILCNTGTIAGTAGAKIADNDITCLPYVIRHRGVNELRDLFKDKPAVLVSTGPSLAKNIHHLIDNQDKLIIIAVGQALRVLLAYDIKPDFICTVDFGEVNIGHFKGMMDSGVPLVTINRTYAPLLREWQGPKFIAGTPVPGHEHTAAGILQEKGFVDSGGSVAHLCYGISQLLGCNPVTFVGQDLALGATSHIPLADAGGAIMLDGDGNIGWYVKDKRCPIYKENEVYGMGPVQYVEGFFGGTVSTNTGLLSFKTVFESMVERSTSAGRKIHSSVEGGAHIKGTDRIQLSQYIEKYCTDGIDKAPLKALMSFADNADELVNKAIPLLKSDIENLDLIISSSRKGLAANMGMIKLFSIDKYHKFINRRQEILLKRSLSESFQKHPSDDLAANEMFYAEFPKKLRRSRLKAVIILSGKNYFWSKDAQVASANNPLVNVAIHGAARKIQGRALSAKGDTLHFLKNRKDARIRIERNSIILKAALKAAKSLIGSYKTTLELLEEYQKTKDDALLVSTEIEPINLDDVEDYFEAGNWAHPLLDSDKLITRGGVDELSRAYQILEKAQGMREEAIESAKADEAANAQKDRDLLKFNDLLKRGRDAGGKDNDFKKAVQLLKEANELQPENIEALWGYASSLHHAGNEAEAVLQYKRLIDKKPEEKIFRFQYGQNLMQSGNVEDGLKEVCKAMEDTNQFDYFLPKLAEIYSFAGLHSDALEALEGYLSKNDFSYDVWEQKGKCLLALDRKTEAEQAFDTARGIRG